MTWHWLSGSVRSRCERPKISEKIRDVVQQMSLANPLRGASRIHGELLTLGIEASQLQLGGIYLGVLKLPPRLGAAFCQKPYDKQSSRSTCSWSSPRRLGCFMRRLDFITIETHHPFRCDPQSDANLACAPGIPRLAVRYETETRHIAGIIWRQVPESSSSDGCPGGPNRSPCAVAKFVCRWRRASVSSIAFQTGMLPTDTVPGASLFAAFKVARTKSSALRGGTLCVAKVQAPRIHIATTFLSSRRER
jgi:hypothetical protein